MCLSSSLLPAGNARATAPTSASPVPFLNSLLRHRRREPPGKARPVPAAAALLYPLLVPAARGSSGGGGVLLNVDLARAYGGVARRRRALAAESEGEIHRLHEGGGQFRESVVWRVGFFGRKPNALAPAAAMPVGVMTLLGASLCYLSYT
jgi:hypothetical protein